jgi:4-aminobutyrate aminotransferase-like enzyme
LEETIINEGPETVAAFVFEPVQGDGGAVDMHREFFPLAEQICKKHGVLMIADEVGGRSQHICVYSECENG